MNALRGGGFDVLTANKAGTDGLPDVEHLTFAAAQERAIISQNVGHFQALHSSWMASGLSHWGIVLIHQRDQLGPGEVARRMELLAAVLPREQLRDRLIYLSGSLGSLRS